MTIRLYFDEDCARRALVSALRVRGVDARTPVEAGMQERDDDAHLDYATAEGRVIYTFNVGDFYRLHTAYLSENKSHAGIVIGRRGIAIGDQLRGLLRLMAVRSAEQMINHVEFLSSWLLPPDASSDS